MVFAVVERTSADAALVAGEKAPTRNTTGEVAVGISALGVAGVIFYLLWQSAAPGEPSPEARPLVEEIAALDVDFEAGRVKDKLYRQKRKALKQRLRAMLSGQADD